MAITAAAALVSAASATLSASVSAAAPAIKGGINAEPSMRPWVYAGPNPDGWWCQPPNCFQAPDPVVTIDAELGLAKQLNVVDLRGEFPGR